MVKQVIVMRKDLKMRKGKMIAQGAHASMKVFFDRISFCDLVEKLDDKLIYEMKIISTPEMKEWAMGIFKKICVGVDAEQELLDVYNKAHDAGLPCAKIVDAGLTEFHGVPTLTCCAIGPANEDKIDIITGHLKLL
jgi:PTH2 family peptidyl-tRNA hydrolase